MLRMNEDLDNIQYSLIRNYPYAEWFRERQYNGKTLTEAERKELITVADETTSSYAEGLPMLKKMLEDNRGKHGQANPGIPDMSSAIVIAFFLTSCMSLFANVR